MEALDTACLAANKAERRRARILGPDDKSLDMAEVGDEGLDLVCDHLGVGARELAALRARFDAAADECAGDGRALLARLLTSIAGGAYTADELALIGEKLAVADGAVSFVAFVRWWAGGHDDGASLCDKINSGAAASL